MADYSAELTIASGMYDRICERLIVPRNCNYPERTAQVMHALVAFQNHKIIFGFIVLQTRLTVDEVDVVIERWIRDAVLRRREYPIVLRNKLKRFLIEKAIEMGKVKRAR